MRGVILRTCLRQAAMGVLAAVIAPTVAVAQQEPSVRPPVDTTGLAYDRPGAIMEMLYERTIFNVDVLTLTLRFGTETATELERLLGSPPSEALEDSIARIALASTDVLVTSRFLRNASLDQFLDGLSDSLEKALEAGFISTEAHQAILADVEVQYAPLREEGIREGDVMWYRIKGDTLHLAFQRVDGGVPVEERPVGAERRIGLLAGYLAPGSDFREGLIRSVLDDK
jgi:hypothetical protein